MSNDKIDPSSRDPKFLALLPNPPRTVMLS
jgi:hypothetical protein